MYRTFDIASHSTPSTCSFNMTETVNRQVWDQKQPQCQHLCETRTTHFRVHQRPWHDQMRFMKRASAQPLLPQVCTTVVIRRHLSPSPLAIGQTSTLASGAGEKKVKALPNGAIRPLHTHFVSDGRDVREGAPWDGFWGVDRAAFPFACFI